MLPAKNDPRWGGLLTGEIAHKFKSVPAGMCVSRNTREYNREPTPERLRKSIEETYAFFEKYENIITDDIAAIFGKEAGSC